MHAGARGLEEEGRASTEKTKRCAPFFVPTHYCSIAAVAVVFFPGELEFLKERGAWGQNATHSASTHTRGISFVASAVAAQAQARPERRRRTHT